MDRGRWFFRAIEDVEGWTCRHGVKAYDTHPTLEVALDHLAEIASASRPAQIVVHYLDGAVVFGPVYE